MASGGMSAGTKSGATTTAAGSGLPRLDSLLLSSSSGALLAQHSLPVVSSSHSLNQPKATAAGVYVGAGLTPVSSKLAERIRQWEFIDMSELLPEIQLFGEEGKASTRKNTVVDILTWVQCFGTYVAVLGPCFPECVPELMAYMQEIVKASQSYQGRAWVFYDATFRRQAAVSGNRRWSEINGTLHRACYADPTGPRCELCMSVSHKTGECVLMGGLRETGAGSPIRTHGGRGIRTTWRHLPPSGEVCRAWNQNRCRFPGCRHTHVCELCGGNHPATTCQWAQGMHRPSPRNR